MNISINIIALELIALLFVFSKLSYLVGAKQDIRKWHSVVDKSGAVNDLPFFNSSRHLRRHFRNVNLHPRCKRYDFYKPFQQVHTYRWPCFNNCNYYCQGCQPCCRKPCHNPVPVRIPTTRKPNPSYTTRIPWTPPRRTTTHRTLTTNKGATSIIIIKNRE